MTYFCISEDEQTSVCPALEYCVRCLWVKNGIHCMLYELVPVSMMREFLVSPRARAHAPSMAVLSM